MTRHASIGFGIVGTGMAAELHARAITACADNGVRIAGFASRRPDNRLAAEVGRPCMQLDDMLKRPDVDVVCICSPSGLVTIPYKRSMEYYGSAAWRGTWSLYGEYA